MGADELGTQLQGSFIWTGDVVPTDNNLHAGFRRSFALDTAPTRAQLHLFAYTRYQLFVNGDYVGRGPNRFEKRRPEYDTWDIARHLHAGTNAIAVLVHRDWPGDNTHSFSRSLSRFRRHDAGFTARLELVGQTGKTETMATDSSWHGFVETGFGQPLESAYASIPENYDAQKSPGAWRLPTMDDASLPFARKITTTNLSVWPVLSPRTIPLLQEKEVHFAVEPAPATAILTNGGEWKLHCQEIVQAYWVLEFDATAGTKIIMTPQLPEGKRTARSQWLCREGHQEWIGNDTFAFNTLEIRIESGRASLVKARLMEVRYPFERIGSFACSDPALDKIWKLTARSLELLSEDAYTDCADRERSEWMDCDPPMYDATRVMMAGPAINGVKAWSDPRLFKNMRRRVALTQEPDGMLRARTCSELVDIHTRMEDRACDWVDGLRKYYEATGDQELIRELWPECDKLLQWFAGRMTTNGLVRAREWIAWDNPMSYATCEGAGNNAFIQRAFSDAAWLAGQTGNPAAGAQWARVAEQIKSHFNRLLWDENAGAYFSAVGTVEVLPGDRLFKKAITLTNQNGCYEPTLHANLFALDRGIVPPERLDRVVQWTLSHESQIKQVMANYYYFKILYGLDQPRCDQIVLDRIRHGWQSMLESPWQTTWESMGGGSKVHCYGIVPGYILSAYVLGVRRDAPVWEKQLIIEPHLADLTHAEGVVITEFGPVSVAWKKPGEEWQFQLSVPENCAATLALPSLAGTPDIRLDGQRVAGQAKGTRYHIVVASGSHTGSYLSGAR